MLNTFFELKNFKHRAVFENCKYPWDVLKNLYLYLRSQKSNIEIPVPEGVHLVNPELISIGKGTKVEPGVYIEGPCVIGENCEIRHGAYIRGGVLMGDGCVVGHTSEIKHSILLDGAKAPHFNYVGDSILGNNVNLGAGVKLANFRFDGKIISVYFAGEKISTGLNKLGAIVGDNASLGCNSVTNPGSLIKKMALFHPCTSIIGKL